MPPDAKPAYRQLKDIMVASAASSSRIMMIPPIMTYAHPGTPLALGNCTVAPEFCRSMIVLASRSTRNRRTSRRIKSSSVIDGSTQATIHPIGPRTNPSKKPTPSGRSRKSMTAIEKMIPGTHETTTSHTKNSSTTSVTPEPLLIPVVPSVPKIVKPRLRAARSRTSQLRIETAQYCSPSQARVRRVLWAISLQARERTPFNAATPIQTALAVVETVSRK